MNLDGTAPQVQDDAMSEHGRTTTIEPTDRRVVLVKGDDDGDRVVIGPDDHALRALVEAPLGVEAVRRIERLERACGSTWSRARRLPLD